MAGLTVGKLAKLSQVSTVTVRYYERTGLIPKAIRTSSGYRLYPEGLVARMRFIKNAKDLGFSLEEIEELLDLQNLSNAKGHHVKEHAHKKMELIRQKIKQLQSVLTSLEELDAVCHGDMPIEECPILESIYHGFSPQEESCCHKTKK